MKEILSTNDIALLQNVSGSRIRQIWSQVQDDKDSTGLKMKDQMRLLGMKHPIQWLLLSIRLNMEQ